MPTPLRVNAAERPDGTRVLEVVGEVDMSNVDVFTAGLTDVTGRDGAPGSGPVTVDLSGVDYVDSCAISAMFGHADRIRIVANPLLLRVLTVSGLTELVSVQTSAPAADT